MDIRPYPIPSEMTYFDIIAVKLKKKQKKNTIKGYCFIRAGVQTVQPDARSGDRQGQCWPKLFYAIMVGIEITLPGLTKYCFEMTWEANDCLQMSEKCTVSSYGGFIPDIFARVLSFGASKNNLCFHFASHKTTAHNTESLVNPKWSRCDIL